jgi:aspartyl protease family protein
MATFAVSGSANAPVEAVGLFKDRAMIRVLGKEHYLTIGQTSPEGATLVESDAQHAVVRYKDETYKLTLSDRVGGTFQAANQTSLSIAPDEIGQYRMQGSINGHMSTSWSTREHRWSRSASAPPSSWEFASPIRPNARRWSRHKDK